MKKILAVMIACVMVVLATACTKGKHADDAIEDTGDLVATKEIAIAIGRAALEEYLEERPFKQELDATEENGVWNSVQCI